MHAGPTARVFFFSAKSSSRVRCVEYVPPTETTKTTVHCEVASALWFCSSVVDGSGSWLGGASRTTVLCCWAAWLFWSTKAHVASNPSITRAVASAVAVLVVVVVVVVVVVLAGPQHRNKPRSHDIGWFFVLLFVVGNFFDSSSSLLGMAPSFFGLGETCRNKESRMKSFVNFHAHRNKQEEATKEERGGAVLFVFVSFSNLTTLTLAHSFHCFLFCINSPPLPQLPFCTDVQPPTTVFLTQSASSSYTSFFSLLLPFFSLPLSLFFPSFHHE